MLQEIILDLSPRMRSHIEVCATPKIIRMLKQTICDLIRSSGLVIQGEMKVGHEGILTEVVDWEKIDKYVWMGYTITFTEGSYFSVMVFDPQDAN